MNYRILLTVLLVPILSPFLSLSAAVNSQDAATLAPGKASEDIERNRERDYRLFVQAVAVLRKQLDAQREHKVAQNSEGADGTETDVGVAETDAPAADASEKNITYHRQPLRTGIIRAPRPGLRPSPNPLEAMNRSAIRDAVMRPLEFGAPGLGFEPPDWTEPLRDLKADSMVTDLSTGETVLKTNVRLRLGEMLFNSDEFRYSEAAGSYKAIGNVIVTQQSSELTASSVEYFAPEDEVVEKTFILEPAPSEAVFARRRLTMGRLLAENLEVVEPTRHLYADYVDYDFATQTGELRNTHGLAAVFLYNAEHVQLLGPEDAKLHNAWFTTCPREEPHYRLLVDELTIRGGEAVAAKKARLQLGNYKLPFYLPLWKGGKDQPWALDFDSGRQAEIGYFVNTGILFEATPEVSIGPRIMPTSKEGIGLGGDLYYDFYDNPSSYLYRTKGEAHVLYTHKDRGHGLWRHRYDMNNDLTLRMEAEQWSDQEYFKEFFYDDYKNRTTPRTFANLSYRQPSYIATATTRVNTHSWIRETERLPEGSFHLIDRPLLGNFHVAYDNVTGYNRLDHFDIDGARTVNIGRLSYNWDPLPALGVTPFYQVEGTWYQRLSDSNTSGTRFSNLFGVTLETRFHKVYPGMLGFSAFKHIVVPSITYSYRPSSTLSPYEAPQYDALDNVYGYSRIETKISNVFLGREAESNEVWQVGRISLYQGNDFWNEVRKSEDYEVEVDIRPRPWWGTQFVGERHTSARYATFENPKLFERLFPRIRERIYDYTWREELYGVNRSRADYSRILTQFYYDNTMLGGRFNGRVGFAYTDTDGQVFNRELLYGMGYKLGENWGLGFEHIYNLEADNLRSQTYELRRKFDCWETAIRVRDRESGFDVNLEVSLLAFPGSAIKF